MLQALQAACSNRIGSRAARSPPTIGDDLRRVMSGSGWRQPTSPLRLCRVGGGAAGGFLSKNCAFQPRGVMREQITGRPLWAPACCLCHLQRRIFALHTGQHGCDDESISTGSEQWMLDTHMHHYLSHLPASRLHVLTPVGFLMHRHEQLPVASPGTAADGVQRLLVIALCTCGNKVFGS